MLGSFMAKDDFGMQGNTQNNPAWHHAIPRRNDPTLT